MTLGSESVLISILVVVSPGAVKSKLKISSPDELSIVPGREPVIAF